MKDLIETALAVAILASLIWAAYALATSLSTPGVCR